MQFFLIDDDRAQRELELTKLNPPSIALGWFYETTGLTGEQREDSLVRQLEDALGLTREWRLELCRRVATLPSETASCDPSEYAL